MRKITKPEAQKLAAHLAKVREAAAYIDDLATRAEEYASERSEAWEESEGGAQHAELCEMLDGARTALEEAIDAVDQLIPA